MNALRVAQRVAPRAVRPFKTSAPAQGVVSSVGTLGILGIMLSGVKPEPIVAALPKAEYQVLAWIGGMTVFGTMASMGGGKKEAAPAAEEEVDWEAVFAEADKK